MKQQDNLTRISSCSNFGFVCVTRSRFHVREDVALLKQSFNCVFARNVNTDSQPT